MNPTQLPAVAPLKKIKARLPIVFPESTQQRGYLVREIAAKTIFVMLYAGAVEGTERWVRPNQVTRMTDAQSARTDDQSRLNWVSRSLMPGRGHIRGRWYAVDTREPIRDETIRFGLIEVGAVLERPGIPITSAKPRYALAKDFASLFTCCDAEFLSLVELWQKQHLTTGALARVKLVQRAAIKEAAIGRVEVKFPSGETRHMSAGPSSIIGKAVIEEFTARFLEKPALIFLSDSREKVVARDSELAKALKLNISKEELLPDIILADLGPETPLIVFVEVVATDGPITESRKASLLRAATEGGHAPDDVAFVTAMLDRSAGMFRKVSSEISWGSFVWFASEPEHIIHYRGASKAGVHLSDLLG